MKTESVHGVVLATITSLVTVAGVPGCKHGQPQPDIAGERTSSVEEDEFLRAPLCWGHHVDVDLAGLFAKDVESRACFERLCKSEIDKCSRDEPCANGVYVRVHCSERATSDSDCLWSLRRCDVSDRYESCLASCDVVENKSSCVIDCLEIPSVPQSLQACANKCSK